VFTECGRIGAVGSALDRAVLDYQGMQGIKIESTWRLHLSFPLCTLLTILVYQIMYYFTWLPSKVTKKTNSVVCSQQVNYTAVGIINFWETVRGVLTTRPKTIKRRRGKYFICFQFCFVILIDIAKEWLGKKASIRERTFSMGCAPRPLLCCLRGL
jgi:hypothetical protein